MGAGRVWDHFEVGPDRLGERACHAQSQAPVAIRRPVRRQARTIVDDIQTPPALRHAEAHVDLENMHDLEAGWYEMGCDLDYGSIVTNTGVVLDAR